MIVTRKHRRKLAAAREYFKFRLWTLRDLEIFCGIGPETARHWINFWKIRGLVKEDLTGKCNFVFGPQQRAF